MSGGRGDLTVEDSVSGGMERMLVLSSVAAELAPIMPEKKAYPRKMPKNKAKIGRFKGSGAKQKRQSNHTPALPSQHPSTSASASYVPTRPSRAAERKPTLASVTQQLGYAVRSKRAAETTSKEERLKKDKKRERKGEGEGSTAWGSMIRNP